MDFRIGPAKVIHRLFQVIFANIGDDYSRARFGEYFGLSKRDTTAAAGYESDFALEIMHADLPIRHFVRIFMVASTRGCWFNQWRKVHRP
jgi:hypothetical protein